MDRFRFAMVVVAVLTGTGLAATPATLAAARAALRTAATTPVNVDISQRHLNESEEAIAVNPANPANIVTVTNVGHGEAGLTAGMFEGVSFDGGKMWTRKLIALGGSDPLGDETGEERVDIHEWAPERLRIRAVLNDPDGNYRETVPLMEEGEAGRGTGPFEHAPAQPAVWKRVSPMEQQILRLMLSMSDGQQSA